MKPTKTAPPKANKTRALVALVVMVAGCTTSNTRWGDPNAVTATKPDMNRYGQDSYECVRESKQEIGFGEFASSTQRDAQRLYNLCMTGRGYTVKETR